MTKERGQFEHDQGQAVLVTGASGFLGRHLSRLLHEQGFRVIGLGHGSWTESEQRLWGVAEWHEGDVCLETLDRVHAAPTLLFHCAGSGSVPFANEHPLADFYRTVVPTVHVLEYVRTRAPQCRLVYPSSAGVYGTAQAGPLREDTAPSPISKYAEHKAMAEGDVRFSARHYGLHAAVVRLFSVYGPGQCKQLLWDACHKLDAGNHVFAGTGEELRDWIHVEDAASLMLAAAQHASPACPVVNGGCGEGVAVRSIVEQVAQSLFGEPRAISFSGAGRSGDPVHLVADSTMAHGWGWLPQYYWRSGIAEYVEWWQAGRFTS